MNHPSKTLHITLWLVQAVLALLLVGTGIFKLITPIPELAALWPWAGEYPGLLRFAGVVDALGGLGLVLPGLARIRPGLTRLAALGVALLMVCAIVFHLARGEAANTPFNFVVLALALFVWWGRR
jgi:hypothetical protein